MVGDIIFSADITCTLDFETAQCPGYFITAAKNCQDLKEHVQHLETQKKRDTTLATAPRDIDFEKIDRSPCSFDIELNFTQLSLPNNCDPYPPTLFGIDRARTDCISEIKKIIREVGLQMSVYLCNVLELMACNRLMLSRLILR